MKVNKIPEKTHPCSQSLKYDLPIVEKKNYFSKLDWTGVSVSSSLQNLQKERS